MDNAEASCPIVGKVEQFGHRTDSLSNEKRLIGRLAFTVKGQFCAETLGPASFPKHFVRDVPMPAHFPFLNCQRRRSACLQERF